MRYILLLIVVLVSGCLPACPEGLNKESFVISNEIASNDRAFCKDENYIYYGEEQ